VHREVNAFRRQPIVAAALSVMLIGITAATYGVARQMALSALQQATSQSADLYAANLQSEMQRFEYLPKVIAVDPRVSQLLESPSDVSLRKGVDEYLETIDASAGAAAIYVMDKNGLTLATSNWNQSGSFANMNFSYRPYFQDALLGKRGRFYGIGTVSREPGYYFSIGVRNGDRVLGVAAVKVNLERLDQSWANATEKILVADGNGIVFLSSEPQWKFKTLQDLPKETVGRLAATRQYSEAGALAPLGLRQRELLANGNAIVDGDLGTSSGAPSGKSYLVLKRALAGTDWRMSVLADMTPVLTTARNSAAVAALAVVLLALLFLYLKQRRTIITEAQAARRALQRAYEELEDKVHARTGELSDANRQLQNEIAERRRAEDSLRATLENVVHTAKMAVLGQMSASITHELNQPLAAVQTLSENTVILFQRGRQEEAMINLRMIAKTTAHMGKITGQLKKFARRSEVGSEPVAVGPVVSDALFLLREGARGRNVRLECLSIDDGAVALCEANRLEQVIVNLLSNAIDAVDQASTPAIEVVVRQVAGSVTIEVHDNGRGLTEVARDHMFEPFFTTKPQGIGLGLGLAISNDIVRHFGGTLSAGRSETLGGAKFVVQLRSARQEVVCA
jgi:C4-dicarboxylate-specific signal transduction histidine kinase